MYTHVLLITLLTPCSMSDQYISLNDECTHIFTDNTPYTMLYVSSLFWYLILNERLARLAIYQSVSQFKNRGNKGIPFVLQRYYYCTSSIYYHWNKQAARIGNNTFLFVHRGLHRSSQVEQEPRYVQYWQLLLSQ